MPEDVIEIKLLGWTDAWMLGEREKGAMGNPSVWGHRRFAVRET